jgi:hypothetical protein
MSEDFAARVKAYFDGHAEPAGRLILDLLRAVQKQQTEIAELKTRLGFWERKP